MNVYFMDHSNIDNHSRILEALKKVIRDFYRGFDLRPALAGSYETDHQFFLEGPEGLRSGAIAAENLKKRYPKLTVAGTAVIAYADEKEATAAIKSASRGREIDLLFVAYGHGRQEQWIARNLSRIPVKVAVGIGGALDFAAGVQKRAPVFIRRLGLEWFYRLLPRPGRVWRGKRQLALLPFIERTFRESFKRI